MAPTNQLCFLCNNVLEVGNVFSPETIYLKCSFCGTFESDLRTIAVLKHEPDFNPLRPYLSAHARQSYERGSPAKIDFTNWREIAESHKRTTVPEKLDLLLRYFAKLAPTPGLMFDPSEADRAYVLFDAASGTETSYLTDVLVDEALIKRVTGGRCVITPRGWAALSAGAPNGEPGTCFVAMAFRPDMDLVYDAGFAVAIRNCGLTGVRADRPAHNDRIDDQIMARIRRCQVLIADFTYHRRGVYFEAGFAQGLGRTVVWTCRHDHLKRAHFDTRQYSHVVWNDVDDLANKLEAKMRATIAIPVR
jgi:hypothetical protein